MDEPLSTIRGLINDLTRTLTGSLVHLDDLLLRLDNDSEEFDEACLANDQLGRALEFFLELRTLYLILHEKLQFKKESLGIGGLSTIDILAHKLNNSLLVIGANCDLMSIYSTKSNGIFNTIQKIYKTIGGIKSAIYKSLDQNRRQPHEDEDIKPLINNLGIKKPTKNGLRIMLVEDDDDVRDTITQALTKASYEVVAYANGRDALTKIDEKKSTYSLYIVDFGLPDMNGVELADNLLLRKPEINILIITGYNELILKNNFNLKYQYQIMMKPFRLPELYERINEIVHH